MLKVVEKQDAREAGEELLRLDEIAREGARRMLIEALRAEADDYVERHRGERDEHGRALVVRNGRAQPRKLTLGAGTVELKAPRWRRPAAARPCQGEVHGRSLAKVKFMDGVQKRGGKCYSTE